MDNLFLNFTVYEFADSRRAECKAREGPFRETVLLDNKQFPEIYEVIWQNPFSQPAIF